MNWEEKSEQLYEYLESVLHQTGNFVVEQSPLLVQEFFLWFTAHHIFFIALSVILIISGVLMHQIGKDPDNHKRGRDLYRKSDGKWFVPVGLSWLVGIIMFFSNTYNLLQILVAPRIYLIEKLATWFTNQS